MKVGTDMHVKYTPEYVFRVMLAQAGDGSSHSTPAPFPGCPTRVILYFVNQLGHRQVVLQRRRTGIPLFKYLRNHPTEFRRYTSLWLEFDRENLVRHHFCTNNDYTTNAYRNGALMDAYYPRVLWGFISRGTDLSMTNVWRTRVDRGGCYYEPIAPPQQKSRSLSSDALAEKCKEFRRQIYESQG